MTVENLSRRCRVNGHEMRFHKEAMTPADVRGRCEECCKCVPREAASSLFAYFNSRVADGTIREDSSSGSYTTGILVEYHVARIFDELSKQK